MEKTSTKIKEDFLYKKVEIFHKFFLLNSPNDVINKLWDIFRLAVNGGLEKEKSTSVENVALLFDQLTDLVAAVYAFYKANHEPNKQEETAHD